MKIITVTPNTAIDRLVTVSRGRTSPEATLFPAGKGINVARTVNALGGTVVALGFVGEPDQEFFATAASPALAVRLIPVAGKTRTNTTTFDLDRQLTTHERTQGFEVTAADWERLAAALHATMEPGDFVIFSGSLPPGSPRDAYARLIRQCHRRNVRAILDSSGDELREGIAARPFLIKPNLEELAELCGEPETREPWADGRLAAAARRLHHTGIPLVVVSRGAAGIIAVAEAGAWAGNVELDRPAAPTGSVGSGDALVAGIVTGLVRQLPLAEALRLGIACGAANVLQPGPGICDSADIARLSQAAVLQTLD